MKIKTLAVLTGLGAPLIATSSAAAGFVGVKLVGKNNPYGLIVFNIYAEFDRPGEDHMIAVAGTPNAPLEIQVEGGGSFYNNLFGTDQAPSTALVAAFPSLAFDSFVSIGVKSVGANGQPFDDLAIAPGLPSVSGTQLYTTNSGWAVSPSDPQGDPFNPDFCRGDGQILIGQFSTANGTWITGRMLLSYISNGEPGQTYWVFPAPGAAALLGVAGLFGTGRRRRR